MPHQNRPDPATLCHFANWFLVAVFDRCHGILRGQSKPTGEGYPYWTIHRHSPCHKIIITIHEEKWVRHHPDPQQPTHLRYDYLFSYAQGNFNIERRQTPSVFVLQFYHPVCVFVKCCPEKVFAILGCNKHTISCMLLDDHMCIRIHEIRKAILCLARDGCDGCEFHDVCLVEMYVCNLVEMCVSSRSSVPLVRLSHGLDEIVV